MAKDIQRNIILDGGDPFSGGLFAAKRVNFKSKTVQDIGSVTR
jgi:hypothetical protein